MLNFRILIEESHFFARFSPLISICELLFALLSHCHYIIKGKLTCPTPSLPNSPLFFSFSFWPGLVFVLFAPDCAATRTATPPAALQLLTNLFLRARLKRHLSGILCFFPLISLLSRIWPC